MILSHPLARVFGGTRALLLEHLLETRGPLSVRQAARLTGIAATTASVALQALHEAGLVDREDVGTSRLYRVVEMHALVQPLRQVMAAAREVDHLVVEMIRQEIEGVLAVWLYGSRARGEDRPDSDADLLVILDAGTAGARALDDLTDLSDRLRQLVGVPVSLTALPKPDARAVRQRFWQNVLVDAVALDGLGPHDLLESHSTRRQAGRRKRSVPA